MNTKSSYTALNIGELLTQIISYIQDPSDLRSAARVSRSWNLIAVSKLWEGFAPISPPLKHFQYLDGRGRLEYYAPLIRRLTLWDSLPHHTVNTAGILYRLVSAAATNFDELNIYGEGLIFDLLKPFLSPRLNVLRLIEYETTMRRLPNDYLLMRLPIYAPNLAELTFGLPESQSTYPLDSEHLDVSDEKIDEFLQNMPKLTSCMGLLYRPSLRTLKNLRHREGEIRRLSLSVDDAVISSLLNSCKGGESLFPGIEELHITHIGEPLLMEILRRQSKTLKLIDAEVRDPTAGEFLIPALANCDKLRNVEISFRISHYNDHQETLNPQSIISWLSNSGSSIKSLRLRGGFHRFTSPWMQRSEFHQIISKLPQVESIYLDHMCSIGSDELKILSRCHKLRSFSMRGELDLIELLEAPETPVMDKLQQVFFDSWHDRIRDLVSFDDADEWAKRTFPSIKKKWTECLVPGSPWHLGWDPKYY